MKQQDIIMSIRQRYQNINSCLALLQEGFDEESVRGFRQEIGRLRALFRLIGEKASPGIPDKLLAFDQKMAVVGDLQLLRRELILYGKEKKLRLPLACLAMLDGRLATALRLVSLDLESCPPDIREPVSWSALQRADLADLSKEFVGEKVKILSAAAEARDLTDSQLCERLEALKGLLYAWVFLDKEALRLIRPAALADRQEILSQVQLLEDYREAAVRLDMLQDPNFLFATGQGSKPFLQAVMEDWLREKQRLREEINGLPVSGTDRFAGRRRHARPVVRSITDCKIL
ncbi:MAG: hypothetical protein JST42_28115 [Bacteroidetes bacterium]|nr:hypothetical protein [Bacteroidota bacterium]